MAPPTEASLRFTVVSRFGDMLTGRTEYLSGGNTRSESRSCSGNEYGPLRAYIHNRDLGYRFELEPQNRIYTAIRVYEYDCPRWMRPGRIELQRQSGRIVSVHGETIDTGDRREMFGCKARRVVTTSRETRDSQLLSESECDGWYIDAPAAWLSLHPPAKPGTFFHLTVGTGERDEYKFSETGTRETGFVLFSTQRHKSYFRDETGDLKIHESVYGEEVTALSESPLATELFVPPRDFKRVPQLPDGVRYGLAHRMRLRWEMLKDSVRHAL